MLFVKNEKNKALCTRCRILLEEMKGKITYAHPLLYKLLHLNYTMPRS